MEKRLNELHENLQFVNFNGTAEINDIVGFYTELVTIFAKTNELKGNERTIAYCCLSFLECIQHFFERCQFIYPNHVIALQKCLQVLRDFSKIEYCLECCVLQMTIPLLQLIIRPDNLKWFNKEVLRNLKTIIKDCDERLKDILVNKNIYHFCKLIDEFCTCGDFEYQMLLLETIIMMFSDDLIQLQAHNLFPEFQFLEDAFCKIDRNNLFYESRKFLNILNLKLENVRSFQVEYALMDTDQITPPENLNGEPELWVDFNISSECISIPCSKSSFPLDTLTESEDEEVPIIKILFANVVTVKMSKFQRDDCDNNDGCLILFLLKSNSVMLSSHNLSKAILKLIVFKNSDVEVLEQVVLPSLFKDRLEKFNFLQERVLDVSNDEVADPDTGNSQIIDKSLSELVSTLSLSDAPSLKSKLRSSVSVIIEPTAQDAVKRLIEMQKKQTDLRTVNDIDSPVTRCLKKPLISYKTKNKKRVARRSVSVVIEQAAQDAVKRFIEMQKKQTDLRTVNDIDSPVTRCLKKPLISYKTKNKKRVAHRSVSVIIEQAAQDDVKRFIEMQKKQNDLRTVNDIDSPVTRCLKKPLISYKTKNKKRVARRSVSVIIEQAAQDAVKRFIEMQKKQTDLRTVNDIDSPVTRCLKKPLISYKTKNKKRVARRSVSVIIEQAAQDAVKRFIEMQKKQTDLRTVNDIDSPVTRCLKKPLISYKKENKKTVAYRSVSVVIEQAAQDAVKQIIEMQTTKFISQVSSAETSKTQSSFNELNDSATTFTTKKELQPTKLPVGNEEQNSMSITARAILEHDYDIYTLIQNAVSNTDVVDVLDQLRNPLKEYLESVN
ncbi:hypothetical protein FQR65_LT04669 [Abscondita terminalis]|nr:hypothetical protein FQR65_LT04669 [Abscondita terminalis]